MVVLRNRWFRSPAYQSKIYSRTLMVTQVRKDYRSDEGLLALIGLLKVDGIKIGACRHSRNHLQLTIAQDQISTALLSVWMSCILECTD
jgi:hypothetical protein